jgi:hypothetical protein
MREVLGPLEHENPTRLFVDPDSSLWVYVPLFPPIGQDREMVLESLLKQLLEPLKLVGLVPEVPSGQGSASPPVLAKQTSTLSDEPLLDPLAVA